MMPQCNNDNRHEHENRSGGGRSGNSLGSVRGPERILAVLSGRKTERDRGEDISYSVSHDGTLLLVPSQLSMTLEDGT